MDQTQTLFDTHLPPLAERLRPTNINDYKGQSHLVGNGKILKTIIEEKKNIFYDTLGSTWYR